MEIGKNWLGRRRSVRRMHMRAGMVLMRTPDEENHEEYDEDKEGEDKYEEYG